MWTAAAAPTGSKKVRLPHTIAAPRICCCRLRRLRLRHRRSRGSDYERASIITAHDGTHARLPRCARSQGIGGIDNRLSRCEVQTANVVTATVPVGRGCAWLRFPRTCAAASSALVVGIAAPVLASVYPQPSRARLLAEIVRVKVGGAVPRRGGVSRSSAPDGMRMRGRAAIVIGCMHRLMPQVRQDAGHGRGMMQ